MKPTLNKLPLGYLAAAALTLTTVGARADGTDPIASATSTISGLSTPVQTAALAVIAVFAIFCLVKLAKKLLTLVG